MIFPVYLWTCWPDCGSEEENQHLQGAAPVATCSSIPSVCQIAPLGHERFILYHTLLCSESEARGLLQKMVDCPLKLETGCCPKYLPSQVSQVRVRKTSKSTDEWCSISSDVGVVPDCHRALDLQVDVQSLTFGHELRVMTRRRSSWIQVAR